jgi:hypothetical protein
VPTLGFVAEQVRTAAQLVVGGLVWAAVVAWYSRVSPLAGVALGLRVWVPVVALGFRRYEHGRRPAGADPIDDGCL